MLIIKNFSFFKFAVSALLIVFLVYQCVSFFYKPITTEAAYFYDAADGLNISTVVIRNETVVENANPGVLHYVIANGERVANGGVIADIYENESASVSVTKIEDISSQIAVFEELQSYNNIDAANLELINERINSSMNALIVNSSSGRFNGISAYSDELLTAISRRQLITGEVTDFSAQIAELKTELAALNSSLPAKKGMVSAGASGYFVSALDGYESVLNSADLNAVTPEYLDSVAEQPVSQSAIGKIVSDYEWYLAATVTLNESLKFKEGDKLQLKTRIASSPVLDVTVSQINLSAEGNSATVVFACQQMNSELASVRRADMTAVRKSYSGLRISRQALRAVNSVTGVYTVVGMQLKFVPVNVLYSTDDYIICEQTKTNDNTLRLYDEVVVKGRKLYDGKIIG